MNHEGISNKFLRKVEKCKIRVAKNDGSYYNISRYDVCEENYTGSARAADGG